MAPVQASHRARKMAISFEYDLVICGYHIYKEIWEASHGETFDCVRETGNRFDPFAVAVISEDGKIIGHINFSCCLFVLMIRDAPNISASLLLLPLCSRDAPNISAK